MAPPFPPRHAGPSRRVWWALATLVALAHLGLLAAWWQQQVDALPNTTPAPSPQRAAPPATELGTVRMPPPTPAPPAAPEKIKQKQAASLEAKHFTAINKETPISPPKRPPAPATPSLSPPSPLTAEALPTSTAPATPTAATATATTPSDPNSAATTPPGPLKWPAAIELRYVASATRKGQNLSADSVLSWQPGANSYQARLEVKALLFGQRSQTSVGTLDLANGLQPTRYGDKSRSERATHFDRTRTPPALRFSANTPDAPLQPHTQDRLSVLLQLAAMFAGEPSRFGPGDTVALHTAGPRDADVWPFRVGTTAPVVLPVGTLDAVHLVRAPLHAYDNRVELWLAPSLGYVPVRMRWTQANGDVVDQQLVSHTP